MIRPLADGRPVAAPWSLVSRRSATGCLLAALGLAGCLIEPINQRPSIDIRGEPSDPVYRGDHLALSAVASDPEGQVVGFQWRVYACTDASSLDCDNRDPFFTSVLQSIELDVPIRRVDGVTPVESLRIVLEAVDELGATAKPSEELVLPVLDAPPTLRLDKTSRYRYVAGTPIEVFALVGDADDGAANVQPLVWEVFGPAGGTHELVDVDVGQPTDPAQQQFGKRFTPMQPGEWQVRVTARDPLGAEKVETLTLAIGADRPPCLAQLSPIVPTDGLALPLTEPTLFRVPVVIDDLDVYPPVTSDAVLGTTTFAWSLQAPGQATHVPIAGAVGNSVALDPSAFTPGDIVELRVEIFDREPEAIPCIDSEQTCSVIAEPACIQRQTWRVEVR